MSNLTDNATINLFVNGERAEQAIDRLKAKADSLKTSIKAAQDAGDGKQAAKLQKELDRVNKELDRTQSLTQGVGIVLKDLDHSTLHGLRNTLKSLQRDLRATKPDTDKWKELSQQIRTVKERMKELNEEIEGSRSLWAQFKDWSIGAWPALDLIKGWYDQMVGNMHDLVNKFADMDQKMANVRKFTGMTEEQVAALNEEFKKMDTRTSREQLNVLAQEAGRLGKTSVEDVIGFVRAADRINVALDDLGQGATLTLSKLTGIFGDEERYGTEQALLKVGSVINELSQNCAASAPYLANFTERLGGVGAQAGMTIQQIMGYGAVLDSNSQKVEASATALSQVIVRLYQDPAKYARVAGLEVESFSRLMREDVNAALILFLETLQKAGGMDVLSPMFKDMGEKGSRAIAALSTLATHIDDVKAQQLAANIAFEEGTSIDGEFAVQNGTVAASLDKCRKAADELRVRLGEYLYPVMSNMLVTGSSILRLLLKIIEFGVKYRSSIVSVTASIAAYLVVLKAEIALKKILSALDTAHYYALVLESKAMAALRPIVLALSVGYNKLTRHATRAAAAQRLLNATQKASLYAAVAAVVVGVVAALVNYARKTREAYMAAKKHAEELRSLKNALTDISQASGEYSKEEISRLDALYNAATRENVHQNERIKAAKKLIQLYPEQFGNMTREQIMLGKAESAYKSLTDAIIKNAEARAAADKITENAGKKIELEGKIRAAERRQLELAAERDAARVKADTTPDAAGLLLTGMAQHNQYAKALKDFEDAENALIAQGNEVQKLYDERAAVIEANEELVKAYGVTPDTIISQTPTGGSSLTNPDDNSKDRKTDRFAAEKAWREEQEAQARISYAQGESLHSEHSARMAQIEEAYYQKLLDRDDLSKTERLKILVQFWEARNKGISASNGVLLEIENSSYDKLLDELRSAHIERLNAEGLSAKERQRETERYNEALELAELNHLKEIVDIYEDGSEEYLAAQRKYEEAQLAARERHLKEMEKKEKEFASMREKVFGMNQAEKDAEFTREAVLLKEVFIAELRATEGNEAEILRIKEAYMAAEAELRKKYNQKGAEQTTSSYKEAIAKSAEWLKGEGGQALSQSLSTAVSGMSSVFSGLSSLIQAELDIQTASIEERYDRELQLAQGNSYRVAKAEKDKEARIAKAKNEANRKMFAMQVIQAVAQTATNALNAYGSAAQVPVIGYILAPIAAAMAVAAGAIQIATIKKQQQASEAQGYMSGGFTPEGKPDEFAGVVHKGEWVASQKLLASPVARPMIEALDYVQRTNTIGSLRAEDVSRSITAPQSLVRISESDGGSALLVAAAARMSRTVDALTSRLEEPFVTINTVTGDHGIRQAQDEYSRLMNNKSPKSRRNATYN